MNDSPQWLLPILSVYLIVWSLLGLGLIVGVIIAVVKIKSLTQQVSKKVEGISRQVQASTDRITQTVDVITDRAQRISDTAESTVRNVADKVDATSSVVRDAVASPLINFSAVLAGIRKGLETLAERRRGSASDEGED